ncbi:MAG: class I SAM-dependent RNA methyltransferase [Rhodospirillaceae bacterium]
MNGRSRKRKGGGGPKRTARLELTIIRLGRHGDGIAEGETGPVFVAGALPGERIEADVAGERGRLLRVLEAAPERVSAPCPLFGACGGCSVQHLAMATSAEWKRGAVATALANRGIDVPVDTLIDAHGAGRRRVTLHVRQESGQIRVGFMRARSHDLLEIDHCPVLAPELEGAIGAARELARCLPGRRRLDVTATLTETGLDVALLSAGELDYAALTGLSETADRLDLARLSADGDPVVTRRDPVLSIGGAKLLPPAGGFLQATAAGETALAALMLEHAGNCERVIDLFAGCGPFTLRLARQAQVDAFDSDAKALAALDAAWRGAPGLKAVVTKKRDLFENPVAAEDLKPHDAALFDPPRAGAEAQARELARSSVATVIAVSCEPATFARDAEILIQGGYRLERVTPVDQFRFTGHVEIVGMFRRA